MKNKEHLGILGFKVEDRVTGFSGVATSVSFDLYGCVVVLVNPGLNADGKLGESCWFDRARLKITDTLPVMEAPNFDFGDVAEGKKGPENKPGFYKP